LQPQGVIDMKKLASALLFAVAPLVAFAGTPALYSRSAVVYDVGRHEILLEKNPDDVEAIASLTKLMTAMVVLDESQSMEETLTINDADIDHLKHTGSRVPIGTSLERLEMLRLALTASENRAASALSRAFPGGERAFIQKMNDKARALHMADTHFDDPSGLSPDDQSTARDVVKMAAAASHYGLIGEFTTLPRFEEVIGSRTRFYRNTDPIVDWPNWGVQLAKTGYTREAGRCIVVDASMSNGEVIIALLGARTSLERSVDLVTIRSWLTGDETPVVVPHMVFASTLHHHHHVLAQSHRVKARLVTYRAESRSTVFGKRHLSKRNRHTLAAG
jgi:serine-type D-Ala-D-Ala endopeptidase (penicillin-binding protein 7)